ncbi:ATP-binding protein [Kitasatospora sp. RB6PN24]|uniref:ATP-binding protein n=1 Tax=Kitasatospora humi TaxID=2893891 RepID=UPI001E46A9D5|nr:ATP-binding protein [Kitasatospora humi]MCC9307308.1 ATP-binding protein [Kitasatospora humi]
MAPTLEDAAETRRRLLDGIARWGLPLPQERMQDVRLLASEVINNAVLHTGKPAIVSATWDGAVVRVAVTDESIQQPVVPGHSDEDPDAHPDEERTHGRGISLVMALSDTWGVDTDEDAGTKTVWFECGPWHPLSPPLPAPVIAVPNPTARRTPIPHS